MPAETNAARAAETNYGRARKLADHRRGYHGMVAAITAALDEAEARGRSKGIIECSDWLVDQYGEAMATDMVGALTSTPSPAAQPGTDAERQDRLIADYFGVTVEEVRRVRAGGRPATPADGKGE